jgi:putative transposase
VNNFNCIRIEKGTISIPKMGKVPIIFHRKIASRIKAATIQFKHGKWSISLTQAVECRSPKQVLSTLAGYDIKSQHPLLALMGCMLKTRKFLRNHQRN